MRTGDEWLGVSACEEFRCINGAARVNSARARWAEVNLAMSVPYHVKRALAMQQALVLRH